MQAIGTDGFPAESYKTLSKLLSPLLAEMLKESFIAHFLPPSLCEASISVLLKKGKNPLDCTSYRLISLFNTDMKILAKALAHRLETVLPNIISPDQTGFVKNRHSFFNLRRLFNVFYSNPSKTPEVAGLIRR